MFKITNPFDGSLIQYSTFRVDDEKVTRTWIDSNGERQFETALAICTETDETPVNTYTAEQFLNKSGYTSLRMISLLDLESKLTSAGKSSAKVNAVRSWVDSILMQYAANPAPQAAWPAAPFEFEPTVQEALTVLNQQ